MTKTYQVQTEVGRISREHFENCLELLWRLADSDSFSSVSWCERRIAACAPRQSVGHVFWRGINLHCVSFRHVRMQTVCPINSYQQIHIQTAPIKCSGITYISCISHHHRSSKAWWIYAQSTNQSINQYICQLDDANRQVCTVMVIYQFITMHIVKDEPIWSWIDTVCT